MTKLMMCINYRCQYSLEYTSVEDRVSLISQFAAFVGLLAAPAGEYHLQAGFLPRFLRGQVAGETCCITIKFEIRYEL